MEPEEKVRLAKELSDELERVIVRFGADRVPWRNSKTDQEVLVLGSLQAAASIMVSLEDEQRDVEAGQSQAAWNRRRLEARTDEEIAKFNARVAAVVEAMRKAVYERPRVGWPRRIAKAFGVKVGDLLE